MRTGRQIVGRPKFCFGGSFGCKMKGGALGQLDNIAIRPVAAGESDQTQPHICEEKM
jgi:hypothetical protein